MAHSNNNEVGHFHIWASCGYFFFYSIVQTGIYKYTYIFWLVRNGAGCRLKNYIYTMRCCLFVRLACIKPLRRGIARRVYLYLYTTFQMYIYLPIHKCGSLLMCGTLNEMCLCVCITKWTWNMGVVCDGAAHNSWGGK